LQTYHKVNKLKNLILLLTGLYLLLAILAGVLPGIIGKSQEGLAAGTTAAVTFFITGGLAAFISALLFRLVSKRHRELDRTLIIIGLVPAVITVITAIGLYIYLKTQ